MTSDVIVPTTFLAPPINFASWKDLQVLGIKLADADGNLTDQGLCAFWACVSGVVSALMYWGGRFYSPLLFSAYKGLSKKDKREWDVRYASMPHSLLCVWYAYIVLWQSDFYYADGPVPNILRTNRVSYTELGISFGFFVVDMFVCLKYHMGGTEMVAHHLGTLLAVTSSIVTGECHMHAAWMLLTEATTPFINMRWWLEKSGMKSSAWYVYNGIGIFLGWIIFRLVIFPPFFYIVFGTDFDQLKLISTINVIIMYVFPPGLTVLNIWWFSKICKGVIKILFAKPAAAPKPKAA